MANNSVAYTEQPDAIGFMDEWLNLARSRSGERGIFNREGSKFVASMSGRRDVNHEFGTNPCFTGDMRLLTVEGYRRFDELDGQDVSVMSNLGRVTSGRVWCSGEREVVEVVMEGSESERTVFRCTPDHVFMLADGTSCEAKDLSGRRLAPFVKFWEPKNKEAFIAGFIQGDGNAQRIGSDTHRGFEINIGKRDGDVYEFIKDVVDDGELKDDSVYSRKALAIAKAWGINPLPLPERTLPETLPEGSDLQDFLCGLFSANGCALAKAYKAGNVSRVCLKTTCEQMANQVVGLLRKLGVYAYVTTNDPKSITWANGEYISRRSFEVNIARTKEIVDFAGKVGFLHEYKREEVRETLRFQGNYVRTVRPAAFRRSTTSVSLGGARGVRGA